MCPVCMATVAVIAGSLLSTGGFAAIAIRKFSVPHDADKTQERNTSKEDRNG